ncbi:MAG: hypothetical protein OQJ84_09740, partial [Xanthomonadales bacterium]|nr:hypothetical protein [Xanthomonadales bacterium]
LALRAGGLIYFPFTASDVLLYIVCAVLPASAIFACMHQSRLVKLDTGIDGLVFGNGGFHRLYKIRLALLAMALLLTIALILQTGIAAVSTGAWLGVLLVLVLAEEVIGRLLFYAAYFRVGV